MAYDSDKPILKHWSGMNSDKLFVEEFQKPYNNLSILDTDYTPHIPEDENYICI